jgi:hypothetical protein
MATPRQITIRNPSPELARRLREMSEARRETLNTTVLSLLEEAVGLRERRERLARYATWTEADRVEFESALSAQRTVDDELWR